MKNWIQALVRTFLRVGNHERDQGIRSDFLHVIETALLTVESSQRSINSSVLHLENWAEWIWRRPSDVPLPPSVLPFPVWFYFVSCWLVLCPSLLVFSLPIYLWNMSPAFEGGNHTAILCTPGTGSELFTIMSVTNPSRPPKEHGAWLYSVDWDHGLWCTGHSGEQWLMDHGRKAFSCVIQPSQC